MDSYSPNFCKSQAWLYAPVTTVSEAESGLLRLTGCRPCSRLSKILFLKRRSQRMLVKSVENTPVVSTHAWVYTHTRLRISHSYHPWHTYKEENVGYIFYVTGLVNSHLRCFLFQRSHFFSLFPSNLHSSYRN